MSVTDFVWQDTDKYLKRPARRQVDSIPVEDRGEDTADYNLWSGRRLRGTGGTGKRERYQSKYRCNPRLDAGRTRGSQGGVTVFCLHFARGKCVDGTTCQYLHRLPTAEDVNLHHDQSTDIFGREKVALNEKGRNRGVGSFERESKTLYVHFGGAGHYDLPKLRKMIEADFGEWGPIESINIIPDKTIAFVKYQFRASAEFAKEAMHNRGFRGSTLKEVLTVAWANDDPNPTAIWTKTLEAQDALEDAVWASFDTLAPEVKRQRLAQLDLLISARQKLSKVATDYPNTDAQYGSAAETVGGTTNDAGQQYPDTSSQYPVTSQHYVDAQYPNTDSQYAHAPTGFPSTSSMQEGQHSTADAASAGQYTAGEYWDTSGQYVHQSGGEHVYTPEEYAAWAAYYAAAASYQAAEATQSQDVTAAASTPVDGQGIVQAAEAPNGNATGQGGIAQPDMEASEGALGLLTGYGSGSEAED